MISVLSIIVLGHESLFVTPWVLLSYSSSLEQGIWKTMINTDRGNMVNRLIKNVQLFVI